jgi:hypothetical protein
LPFLPELLKGFRMFRRELVMPQCRENNTHLASAITQKDSTDKICIDFNFTTKNKTCTLHFFPFHFFHTIYLLFTLSLLSFLHNADDRHVPPCPAFVVEMESY